MTTFDYARPQATANRLLTRYGFDCALRKEASTPAGPNPWDASIGAPTWHTIRAVDTNRMVRDASGTMINQSQRTLLVGTDAGVVPEKADLIAIGVTAEVAQAAAEAGTEADPDTTQYHGILNVRTVAPGGTDILYKIDLVS